MMKLPLEIIEYIYIFLNFDKIIELSQHVSNKVYEKYLKYLLKNNTLNLLKKYSFSKKTLDYFYTRRDIPNNFKLLIYILDSNDPDLCTYIHNKYKHSYSHCIIELFSIICRNNYGRGSIEGDLKMIEWFYINCKLCFDRYAFISCCRYGRVDILEFLNNKMPDIDYSISKCIKDCIENHNLNIVEKSKVIYWLYNNKNDFFTKEMIINVCSEHEEVLYILYKDIPLDVLNTIHYKAQVFNKWPVINFFKEIEFIK